MAGTSSVRHPFPSRSGWAQGPGGSRCLLNQTGWTGAGSARVCPGPGGWPGLGDIVQMRFDLCRSPRRFEAAQGTSQRGPTRSFGPNNHRRSRVGVRSLIRVCRLGGFPAASHGRGTGKSRAPAGWKACPTILVAGSCNRYSVANCGRGD